MCSSILINNWLVHHQAFSHIELSHAGVLVMVLVLVLVMVMVIVIVMVMVMVMVTNQNGHSKSAIK